MARITINPTFEWNDELQKYVLVSHDGQYDVDTVPLRFDRGAAEQAKNQGKQAGVVAGTATGNAAADRAAVIPGLVNDVNNPHGFNPVDKNNMLVGTQESVGGANSGITGEANLSAARTRNAGGFAPALAEAQREKGRQLATGNLAVENENARLKQQQQQTARAQLLGLYGTDTSNAMSAMGQEGEDLSNQLAAGRQGWYQNTIAGINAVKGGKGPAAYI